MQVSRPFGVSYLWVTSLTRRVALGGVQTCAISKQDMTETALVSHSTTFADLGEIDCSNHRYA